MCRIRLLWKRTITDLRSFFQISCHTKFRFAEREAQCILGECGPLKSIIELTDSWDKCPGIGNRIRAVSLTIAQTFPLRQASFRAQLLLNLNLLLFYPCSSNRGYVEEEEEQEITDSGGSVTPTGSTEALIRSRSTPRSLPVDTTPPAAPQRTQEPQARQELSDDESEEESEISGEEYEAGSVAPPSQVKIIECVCCSR